MSSSAFLDLFCVCTWLYVQSVIFFTRVHTLSFAFNVPNHAIVCSMQRYSILWSSNIVCSMQILYMVFIHLAVFRHCTVASPPQQASNPAIRQPARASSQPASQPAASQPIASQPTSQQLDSHPEYEIGIERERERETERWPKDCISKVMPPKCTQRIKFVI